MPSLGFFHPQIVHFVVVLLIVGVAFRWISFTGKFQFTGPAAATLLLLGTLAAVIAVQSGQQAHEVVERIPGIRAAVNAHEEWGENTRNIFLAVAALEILALAFARRSFRKYFLIASGVIGLAGCYAVYQAGDKGGDLVYEWVGGPGLRSGDTADVSHLMMSALYSQAMVDRRAGNAAGAAQLIDQLSARFPNDTSVRLLAAQSLLTDRKDPKAALAALAQIRPAPNDRFLAARVGLLQADAWEAAGQKDSARAVLTRLQAQFPQARFIQDRLARLKP